MPEKYRFW